MNKTLLISTIIVVCLAAIVGLLAFFHFGIPSNGGTGTTQAPGNPFGNATVPANTAQTGTSGSTGTGSMVGLPAQDGSTIPAKDFIHNGQTVSDVENPGSYVLAGSLGYCLGNGTCPQGASTTDFAVSYNQNYGTFTVTLLTEPLGHARDEAAQFLMRTLGISSTQLCQLNTYVGVPYWVNEMYSSGNLSFAACPNAVPLP